MKGKHDYKAGAYYVVNNPAYNITTVFMIEEVVRDDPRPDLINCVILATTDRLRGEYMCFNSDVDSGFIKEIPSTDLPLYVGLPYTFPALKEAINV